MLALAQRVDCAHDERSKYPDAFSGGVALTLKDGTRLERFLTINRGAEGQLLSAEQVREKFLANCGLTISNESAKAMWDVLMQLDEMNDVTGLMTLLRTEASSAG